MALETLNETPEVVADEPAVGAIVKSAAPTKGGIAPVGNQVLSPEQTSELLMEMQKMLAEKTGPMSQFMGGVQDALAYTVPQFGGQQALALQQRAEQRNKEMQDVFGMRQQMAALKASSAQAQAQREAMGQILQGGGGSGSQGAGAPDIFGAREIPPEVRQQIAMDPANGPAILQKYLSTAATERTKARLNPAWYEMTEVVGVDGQITKVPRIQAVEMAMQNPNNPVNRAVIKSSSELSTAAAGAPQLRPQGNAAEIARGLGVPVISGYRSPEKQAELYAASQQPGYSGPPVAKPGSSQHQQGNAIDVDSRKMTPEKAQVLRENGFVQPIPKTDPNHWELAGAREKPMAPTQVAGPAQVSSSEPPRARPGESVQSLQTRQEEWKKEQETRRKGLGTQVEATEKFLENLKSGAEAAKAKSGMVKQIERHATDHPKDFYVSGQTEGATGVLGAISNVRRFTGGEEKGKEAEQAAAPYLLSPEAIKRRKDTDTFAGQLAMGSSKELIGDASVRLGAQIEKMFLDLKGLGTQSPAETNIKAAKMYSIMLERTQRQNDIAREYVAKHPTATPNEIVNSQEYRQVDDWASNKLENIFGNKAKVTPQEMARAELQRRKGNQ